jgi:hypothetical protein
VASILVNQSVGSEGVGVVGQPLHIICCKCFGTLPEGSCACVEAAGFKTTGVLLVLSAFYLSVCAQLCLVAAAFHDAFSMAE